jgi:hypothetical protein
MRNSLHTPIPPGRTFRAWVCLLAVVLLWAPMAAAWLSNGMACCQGGMCMAHRHSKTNQPMPREATPSESPRDCEHHGDSGIVTCSMTCGHENSPSFTAGVIFVLPDSPAICEPARALAAPTSFAPTPFVPSYDPLSPPPRTSDSSL